MLDFDQVSLSEFVYVSLSSGGFAISTFTTSSL